MAKVLVTVDDQLLARIDRQAQRLGLSRSAYLSRLASQDLAPERTPRTTEHRRSTLDRLDRLFRAAGHSGDPVAEVRRQRDRR